MNDKVSGNWNSKSPESVVLDYKQLPYAATEGGRKEFAKDVAAFANRNGGLIVLGIKEKAGKPIDVVGIDEDKVDDTILWLESVSRSGVTPHLPGLKVASQTLEGKTVIVIDVPSGSDTIYEVPAAGQRFFVRDERSVRAMSREEIKFAVRREADLSNRIQDFVSYEWLELLSDAGNTASRLKNNQGGCQLVVFPVFENAFDFRADIAALSKKYPALDSFGRRSYLVKRPFIGGLSYRDQDKTREKMSGFARIYRHGAIVYADGDVMDPKKLESGAHFHPGTVLMDAIISAVKSSIEISADITGATDFYIDYRARTFAGTQIAFFSRSHFEEHGYADRDELIFDPLLISLEDGWKSKIPVLLRPLLDQIWQAFGYEQCLYFNGEGEYVAGRW